MPLWVASPRTTAEVALPRLLAPPLILLVTTVPSAIVVCVE